MNAADLRIVVYETLNVIGKWSKSAENLVVGTAAHESGGFRFRRQINGPALGLWEIEPVTHDSIRNEWQKTHPALLANLDKYLVPGHDATDQLVDNDHYAAGICRLKYAGDPTMLPGPEDIDGLAATWKRVYNAGGRGTVEEFVADYKRWVA